MVSTNYDKEMSRLITEALWEVGVDGLIEIEPGNQLKNELLVRSKANWLFDFFFSSGY